MDYSPRQKVVFKAVLRSPHFQCNAKYEYQKILAILQKLNPGEAIHLENELVNMERMF